MSDQRLLSPPPRRDTAPAWTPSCSASADVVAKAVLVVLLVLVVVEPEYGNLEGKAPVARAVVYPLLAFALPFVWLARPRRGPYPWTADLLLTLVCFSDILGNRLDLYDRVVWFDDWMHLMNAGLVSAAALLLTEPDATHLPDLLDRAVAVGLTASLAWELFELATFMTHSTERPMAYEDTLLDLTLGLVGACVAALVVHRSRRRTRKD
jgi:hypothetical protein